jgi:hypothetical protein
MALRVKWKWLQRIGPEKPLGVSTPIVESDLEKFLLLGSGY